MCRFALHLPIWEAVTFMAPGLGTTSYVVYREHMLEESTREGLGPRPGGPAAASSQELRHISLTIMPENDVVSRAPAPEA